MLGITLGLTRFGRFTTRVSPQYIAGLVFRDGLFIAEVGATLTAFDGSVGGVDVTGATRQHLNGTTVLGTGTTLVVPESATGGNLQLKVTSAGTDTFSQLYPIRYAPPKAGAPLELSTTPGAGTVTIDVTPAFAPGGKVTMFELSQGPLGSSVNSATGVVTIDRSTISVGQYTLFILGSNNSGYSDQAFISLTVTSADVVAPVLSSPILVANGTSAATAGFTTDEGFGTAYWVITGAATQPSVAQIKAGTDHLDAAAIAAASQSVSTAGAQTITPAPTGLPQGIAMYLHVVQEDSASPANVSNRVTSAALTLSPPDTTAPTLSSPRVVSSSITTTIGAATTNEAGGSMFAVAVPTNSAPTADQIIAGQTSAGAAALSTASVPVPAIGEIQVTLAGLSAAQSGYIFLCHRDAAGNKSAVSAAGAFTTAAASNISAFIDDANILSRREVMANYHLVARADGENFFTGISDTTGFTTVTVTSASAMMSASTALAVGTKKVILCAWNGVSSTASASTGPSSAALTANAAVDWGYNRPANAVLIMPAPGYSPEVQSTATGTELKFTGHHKLEFRNMGFYNTRLRITRTSTFPGLPMLALQSNRFRDCLQGAMLMDAGRSFHSEGNTFTNCLYGTIGAAEFIRVWNNKYDDHRENDLASTRGYDNAFQSTWKANIWYFGNKCCKNSQLLFTSGLHPDAFQINASNDIHQGHRLLIEFNILDQNNNPASYPTQTFFGNNYALTNSNDWLVHNNVVAASAYWVCLMADPADNGTKIAYRNLFFRSAYGTNSADTWQAVTGGRNSVGTGSMLIQENYFTDDPSQWNKVNNYTRIGNISIDPRKGAAVGTRMQDILTGNGSWATNAQGNWVYEIGSYSMTWDAALAAFKAFAKPKVGWRGANCGPMDPDTFPAHPLSVSAAAPTITNASGAQSGASQATASVDTSSTGGTLYLVTLPAAGAAPSAAQIIAGQDSTGAAAKASSQAVSTPGTQTITVSALVDGSYKHHFVWRNASAVNSNVLSSAAFSIATADTTAPTLASSSPADNATGVSLSSNITLTFSEAVFFGTGNIALRKNTSGTWSDLELFDVVADVGTSPGQCSVSGSTITLRPTAAFDYSTEYAIRVPATAVKDASNNFFAGIANDTTVSFTSVAAPAGLSGVDTPITLINSTANVSTYSADLDVVAGQYVELHVWAWTAAGAVVPSTQWILNFDGVAQTVLRETSDSSLNLSGAIYGFVAPATGLKNVTIILGGGTPVAGRGLICHAWRLTNYNTSTPVQGSSSNTAYTANVTTLNIPNGLVPAQVGNAILSSMVMRTGGLASGVSGGVGADGFTAVETGTGSTSDITSIRGWQIVTDLTAKTVTYNWATGTRAAALRSEINKA